MFKADGSYLRQLNKIEKYDLLILDDFGLQPLDNEARMILLEIIEDRHGRKSTIVASQLPVAKWYDIIGDSTVADYPQFVIMRSNITVCILSQLLTLLNNTDYFA